MTNQFVMTAGTIQISVPGDLLSTNAEQFRTGALAAIETATDNWTGAKLDLTRARMIDSAGLNAIISVIRKLSARGKKALIHVSDPHVYRVCLFTRMERLAEIVRS